MKVAIASEGDYVSRHFGHCEGYTIYEIAENNIISKEFIENPGHRPGYLPLFLKEMGIDVIISGGMGESAKTLFEEQNIEVITGIEGECDDAVSDYLAGRLMSTGKTCEEHQYKGQCNDD
ncbi:MAG: NifB/NifX family molybdenum-iron cluster-binding protein [Thermoanaerobacteraceae bacterium]|nr:NifB/NifX family molybdenum-iron cluster-binding protein [Thermoanaerobacteraceae bacterium]